MMRAYIDDSASQIGERTLWMAGYLNSAPNWALFSEAWADELRQSPKINYLKMSEALYFKKQFEGWSAEDRDEKLRGLARVIRHFRPSSFGVSVSLAQYDKWMTGVGPYGMDAYYMGAVLTLRKVSEFAKMTGLDQPIDFFFDHHDGLKATVNVFLDGIFEDMPRALRRVVGTIDFKNDIEVLPLQAADMLAWYLRRHNEGSSSDFLIVGVPEILGEPHFESAVPETIIQSIATKISELPPRPMPKTPQQWKNFKKGMASLQARGFVPPYGTRLRNRIARFFGFPRIPRNPRR